MVDIFTPTYSTLPSTSDTYSANEIPTWMSTAGRDIFENVSELSKTPYPVYEGDRLATYDTFNPAVGEDGSFITDGNNKLTTSEQEGLGILGSLDDTFQPYLDDYDTAREGLGLGYGASTRETLLGDPFSMDTAQPFMDIYQDAMNPAVREIEEQTIRSQMDARERAAMGGGSFGSRLGIMEGVASGEGAQAAGDLRARAGRFLLKIKCEWATRPTRLRDLEKWMPFRRLETWRQTYRRKRRRVLLLLARPKDCWINGRLTWPTLIFLISVIILWSNLTLHPQH